MNTWQCTCVQENKVNRVCVYIKSNVVQHIFVCYQIHEIGIRVPNPEVTSLVFLEILLGWVVFVVPAGNRLPTDRTKRVAWPGPAGQEPPGAPRGAQSGAAAGNQRGI